MDENVLLKTQLKQSEDEIEYLKERNATLKTDLSVNATQYKEELRRLQAQIKAFQSGEEIKDAYEYIDRQKEQIISLEEILEEYRQKENFSDLERIHYLELELEELKSRSDKNPFHAGRKKDMALKEYVWKCLEAGMAAKDIIGSEYIGKNGAKKKVSQASFYRVKKGLEGEKEKKDEEG